MQTRDPLSPPCYTLLWCIEKNTHVRNKILSLRNVYVILAQAIENASWVEEIKAVALVRMISRNESAVFCYPNGKSVSRCSSDISVLK